MQDNTRKEYIDIAKGIGIFFIVLGHVCKAGTQSHLRMFCYSFNSDVFFFLSGLTFMGIQQPVLQAIERNRFFPYIKKRFLRILVPYFIWAMISIVIFLVLGKYAGAEASQLRLFPNLLGMLYGNSNSEFFEWNKPLWFLPCLFSASLLWYFIVDLARRLRVRNSYVYILSVILISLPTGYLYNTFCPELYLPFHFETVLYIMPLFGLGLLIREYSVFHDLSGGLSWPGAVISCGLGLAVCAWLGIFDTFVSLRDGQFNGYFRALAVRCIESVSVLLIAIKIARCNILSYIGQRSLAILLMHKFPILFIQNALPGLGRLFEKDFRFRAVSEVIFTVITIALCLIVEKPFSRFAPVLIGEKRRQK